MGLSPMMQHYLKIKEKNPDCVIFYRLGDFYEMFFEDAERVSKLLDLTLTGRDCGLKERAPMCGVPYHAADQYIAKLVGMGEKVAVCEQLSDPAASKGLVERDVVKIISAGTITENTLLDEKSNNFILSVGSLGDEYAVAWADITTGEFYVKNLGKINIDALMESVAHISPSEIICDEKTFFATRDSIYIQRGAVKKFELYKAWAFNKTHAYDALKEYFNVHNLSCFGLEGNDSAISACGALIEFFNETQKRAMINISSITLIASGEYMQLDSTCLKNLEILSSNRDGKRYGSLLFVLDKCETAMGARALAAQLSTPLHNAERINRRLDGVDELYKDALLRNGVKECLSSVKDIERLTGKIAANSITPRDCTLISESIKSFPKLKGILSGAKSQIIKKINADIEDFVELNEILSVAFKAPAPSITSGGDFIADGFDKELDRLRDLKKNSATVLKDIEAREREATGIKNLKIAYNKVFGYYIEVTNSFKDKVPYSYIRKQTLVGAERFITEELKRVEEEILTSSDKAIKLENEIFAKIKNLLKENALALQKTARAIASLDLINSFAIVAKSYGYVRPEIVDEDGELLVLDGRHPVVEAVSDEKFVPNDVLLNLGENNMAIITGPNMAGKSTYMRQVALITLMAHVGSFVPAKSAKIPLTDRIFTRVGASDNLIFDQSTFMVEMSEVAYILNSATKHSLVILDEIGRGTSTYDGLSIAWSVVEYILKNKKCKTLFATHYHELSELEGKLYGVKNYRVTVKETSGTVVFLRKIVEGSANKSFGIEVAALAGVPKGVTTRAKQILKELEKTNLTNNGEVYVPETTSDNNAVTDTELKVLDELKTLDADSLSPREAQNLIYTLKQKLKE